MAATTARVFKSGNSQAVRLPKAFRLSAKTVQVEKTGGGLLIFDPRAEARRVRELGKLYGSCPEFPQIEKLRLADS